MKKAILVVSFGTTHMDTMKVTIEKIENRIKNEFIDYTIKRAFTAHKIIKILKNRDNIIINTPKQALEELKLQGFEEVIVQPLHIIPGEEFDYVRLVVEKYKDSFKKICLGRPALYFQSAEDNIPDDYKIFIDAINDVLDKKNNIVFMGHGTVHYANACYGCLQSVLQDLGKERVYIGTVEGYPTIENVISKLKKDNINAVTLMPLMLVAGDHAKNDMASDEENSWKSILENVGFKCNIYLHGLGELDKFQKIYIDHIKDAIKGTYSSIGKTKKTHM